MAEILVPSRRVRRYGWKPSLPIYGEAFANIGGIEVKDEVDNRDILTEFVENQWALGSCFPAGTLIRKADGTECPIENIRALDEVVTAEGRTGRVTRTMVRFERERLMEVELHGYRCVRMTDEHPVLTDRGYVAAGDLRTGDMVALTRFVPEQVEHLDTSAYITAAERRTMLKRGVSRAVHGGIPGKTVVSAQIIPVPDSIALTRSFGRLIGLWLAEGSSDTTKLTWTLHENEADTLGAEIVQSLAELGCDAHIAPKRSGNGSKVSKAITVRCYGSNWARMFKRMLGENVYDKGLPAALAAGPQEFREGVLTGWLDGDGHDQGTIRTGVSVSKRLALSMFDLAQGLGLRPVLRRTTPKPPKCGVKSRAVPYEVVVHPAGSQDSYRSRMDDTHLWRRVRAVAETEFAGWVYNLSVEGDESYVAEGVGVHNCTANATATHFRFDAASDGKDPGQLCRLGIYWGERKLEGTVGQGDTGAMGHDAFTVAQGGIPTETAWPYEWDGMEEDQPAPEAYFDPSEEPSEFLSAPVAYKLEKQVAAVPQTEQAIKAVLSNGQLISFGFTVYESFESREVATTGMMPMPGANEQILGGHEVLCVGYLKSQPDYAMIMNSWGHWGYQNSGFFFMPWRYLLNMQLASDLRTIVRGL